MVLIEYTSTANTTKASRSTMYMALRPKRSVRLPSSTAPMNEPNIAAEVTSDFCQALMPHSSANNGIATAITVRS